jgi:hypothetical protein
MTCDRDKVLFGLVKQTSLKGITALMVIALIWAVEQFWVQGTTLMPDMSIDATRQFKRELVRFTINISFGLLLVFTFPKRVLYLLFGVNCLIDSGLIAYHDYFHQPLSHFTLVAHMDESVEVYGAFADYFPVNTFILLAASLSLKVFLLKRVSFGVDGFAKDLKRLSIISSLIYLVIVLPLVLFFRPMNELKSWKSTSWFGGQYGYFITWTGESYYLGSNESLLKYANSVANPKREMLPSPIDIIDFSEKNHMVVVQCESFSYWASQLTMDDGEYLMPFINELRHDSISLRIEPIHRVGSSDADFCFLTSKFPNGKVAPYKITGFDYSRALPFLAKEIGYTSYFYHGNRGSFFSRRNPVLKMGFTRVLFQEELEADGLSVSKWGIYDHDVLAQSSRHLVKSNQPMFHFLITLTTHSPFNFLPSDFAVQHASDRGKLSRYFKSMRYLDNSLKDYFASLPAGTWMVLYGDHGPGFKKEDSGFTESVPFIVSRKNHQLELTESQQKRIDPTVRQFDLLDMSRYFRNELIH